MFTVPNSLRYGVNLGTRRRGGEQGGKPDGQDELHHVVVRLVALFTLWSSIGIMDQCDYYLLLLLLPSTPNFYRGILYTTAEGAGRRRAAACGLGESMFGILLTSRESNCMCILKLMNLSQGSSTWVRR